MNEIYARLSKEQRILCGRQDATGHYTCDEPLAEFAREDRPIGPPARRLMPLVGWALDARKSIWRQTTSVEDRRRHGIPQRPRPVFTDLPTLLRCPKCGAVQWLDPRRLSSVPV
jgi:hypothetical protein